MEPFQEECIIEMSSKIKIDLESAVPFSFVDFFSDRLGLSVIPKNLQEKHQIGLKTFAML